MTDYRGLTWDHPRGTAALRAAAARFSGEGHGHTLTWDSQPLEGFESHPIGDLCARYDLVVLDHPHLGDALEADALRPLDDLLPDAVLQEWRAGAVGAATRSYTLDGRLWAAPLDVATQVAALHRAAVPEPPRTWTAALELAETMPGALSLAGPHALLTYFSLCVALGDAPAVRADAVPLVGRETGVAALEAMRAFLDRCDPATAGLNPIALLEHVADGRVAYCPFVYGYVNYASAEGSPVRFADVPRLSPGGPLGSVLGGTGLALSRRAPVTEELVRHIVWLLSAETQRGYLPRHQAQPARREAWTDPAVNAHSGDFYADTLATTESAWVRPRYPGYTEFQQVASELIRDGLLNGRPATALHDDLEALHRTAAEGRAALGEEPPAVLHRK
ncbi:ABC transporter substrate-binding protein [Streptomyces halstedii]|uniref:ABC transporter substrate-binding protein n=1 Tax=Streptomyces halstedii TaxID=1944 RepID=A0ABS6TXK1_STRHA|nr:ABC transporter substrate-binding protein [Streptomyces halstedii]MBV7673008.1 ABC transporter substrate-binding protein [Streptomyces halstedii]